MKVLKTLALPLLTLAAWAVLLIAVPALAQNTTGEIDGRVTDASGASITGATIVVTNSDSKEVVRTLKTNDRGNYSATALTTGTYNITVSAAGFKDDAETGIALTVGDTLTVDAQLVVGSQNETVNVTTNPDTPNVETSENSSIISNKEVKELALNTRNFEALLILQPGVSNGGPDELNPGMVAPTGGYNTQQLSLNGLRPTQLTWSLDGADILNHSGQGQVAIFPSVDAISEIKIIRSSYGAQYGGAGSAQVLLVSKAGGANYHGDAYYFYRNPDIDATPFLNLLASPQQPKPPIRYNNFGYSIGGPVFITKIYPRDRSRTMFFFSQEFRRITNFPLNNQAQYPYVAQANGYMMGPTCLASSGTTCTKYPTYVANSPYPGFNWKVPAPLLTSPPSQADLNYQVAQAYLTDVIDPALAISPPNTATLQTLGLQQASPYSSTQELFRLDHQFNERFSGFLRYVFDPITQTVPDGLGKANGFPGVGTSLIYTYGENLTAHATWTITPNAVLDLGAAMGVNQIKVTPEGALLDMNAPDVVGAFTSLPYQTSLGRVPSITIDGGAWTTNGPSRDLSHTVQGFANITQVVRQHTLYYGANFEHYYETINNGTNNAGSFVFSGGIQSNVVIPGSTVCTLTSPCTASAFEQSFTTFLIGAPTSYTQASIDATSRPAQNLYEAYLQDNWRATSNLTLNIGVRYSIYAQPYDRAGNLGGFQPEDYDPTLAPAIGTNGGLCLPVVPPAVPTAACANATPNPNYVPFSQPGPYNGIVQANGNSPYGSAISRTPFLDIAPRFGFAWNVYGDGKTSLRGGYGIFYNQSPFSVVQSEVAGNPAYVQNPVFSNPSLNAPGASGVSTTIQAISGQVRNWMQPYTQSWSLDLQQQIGKGTTVDIGYVGNGTWHLQGEEDLNQPLPGTYLLAGLPQINSGNSAKMNNIRPYLGYGPINYSSTRFFGDYHGLQTSLIQHIGRNSQVILNYTWSKAMTNSQGLTTEPQNRYDLASEWGPSTLDRRNIFVAHFIYNFPFFKKQQGLRGKALGGWELSGIVQAVGGLWLTATDSNQDPAGQGVNATGSQEQGRVDQIANPNGGPKNVYQFFNTAAFQLVPTGAGRPGNAKPGTIEGPGYQQWNIDVFKNFNLPGEMRFQLRVEAYNVFNHVNYSTVSSNFNSSNFGTVTAAHDMRLFQFGAKFYF